MDDVWTSVPPSPELTPSRQAPIIIRSPSLSRRSSITSVDSVGEFRRDLRRSTDTLEPVRNERERREPGFSPGLGREASSYTSVFSLRKTFATNGKEEATNDGAETDFVHDEKLCELLANRKDNSLDLLVIPQCNEEDDRKDTNNNNNHENPAKLSITSPSLTKLATTLSIPASFPFRHTRRSIDSGPRFRKIDQAQWDYWCLLPFRTQVGCSKMAYEHDEDHYGGRRYDRYDDTINKKQLDPSTSRLHLQSQRIDLVGAQFGVYVHWDAGTKRATAVVVQHEENPRMRDVKAPTDKVEEALSSGEAGDAPLVVICAYISRAARSWASALFEVNKQLVEHQSTIQENLSDRVGDIFLNKNTIKSLDAMTTHLLRYAAELGRINNVLDELLSHLDVMSSAGNRARDEQRIRSLLSQVRSSQLFCEELRCRTQNSSMGLFSHIQLQEHNQLRSTTNTIRGDTGDICRQVSGLTRDMDELAEGNQDIKRAIHLATSLVIGALLATMLSSTSASDLTWTVLTLPCAAAVYLIALPQILESLARAEANKGRREQQQSPPVVPFYDNHRSSRRNNHYGGRGFTRQRKFVDRYDSFDDCYYDERQRVRSVSPRPRRYRSRGRFYC